MTPPPPPSTLFPYTTLFRSLAPGRVLGDLVTAEEESGRRLGLRRLLFDREDRKSTRLNSSHQIISYAVFCLKKKKWTVDIETRFDLHRRLTQACRMFITLTR